MGHLWQCNANILSNIEYLHRAQNLTQWLPHRNAAFCMKKKTHWMFPPILSPSSYTNLNRLSEISFTDVGWYSTCLVYSFVSGHFKNIGRLWLAYTELQGDFTCFNSYLLTLGTLHSQNSAYGCPINEPPLWQYQLRIWACSGTTSYLKGSWAVIDWKCPPFFATESVPDPLSTELHEQVQCFSVYAMESYSMSGSGMFSIFWALADWFISELEVARGVTSLFHPHHE